MLVLRTLQSVLNTHTHTHTHTHMQKEREGINATPLIESMYNHTPIQRYFQTYTCSQSLKICPRMKERGGVCRRASCRYSSAILQHGGCSPVNRAGLYRFPSNRKTIMKENIFSCHTKYHAWDNSAIHYLWFLTAQVTYFASYSFANYSFPIIREAFIVNLAVYSNVL